MTSDLTPVQEVNGLLMKRDDLFQPFGRGEVNGGKLRQCIMLVDAALARDSGAGEKEWEAIIRMLEEKKAKGENG